MSSMVFRTPRTRVVLLNAPFLLGTVCVHSDCYCQQGEGCKLTPVRRPVTGKFSAGQVKFAVGFIDKIMHKFW